MITRIKKFLMVKGVELFTDNVPVRTVRKLFPEVDPIDVLNRIQTAARMTASEWKS